MIKFKSFGVGALLAALSILAPEAIAQTAPAPKGPAAAPAKSADQAPPQLEAKAMALLRGMSDALTANPSMSFTAVVTYESPSSVGPAIAYSTASEVLLQRPNKLRVITSGDGPATEYYYDGKTVTAFSPAENLVAVADAPPTVDATLKTLYDSAAIYFPFSDVVGADPFGNISDGLSQAFYIGQSKVVAGTTTDMIAVASDTLFMQIWIGAQDKLPRRMRAVYRGDPLRLRHDVEFSNWKLDPVVAAEAFAAVNAANAKKIDFAVPQPQAKSKAAKKTSKAKQGEAR
jgi:hypothetical protein